METANDQMVGRQGDHIVVTFPKHRMTRDEALRHAAWICLVADVTDEEWANVVREISST